MLLKVLGLVKKTGPTDPPQVSPYGTRCPTLLLD